MGLIRQYSIIVLKETLQSWLDRGWIEVPDFGDIHYTPKPSETIVLGKPKTLLEIGLSALLGKTITGFRTFYGSYGNGGPGFLGFTLDSQSNALEDIVLVYTVWAAAQFTLIDGRVIECNPQFYKDFHPWISRFADEDIPNWDDLTPVLLGSRIDSIELSANGCIITISKEDQIHIIEFLKNDPRLPPRGDGNPRTDAFSSGVIGDFIVFQHPNAILWV